VTKADDTKADRKASAAAVNDKGAYEDTAFGRRRIGKVPKALATLIWLAGITILFVYRRLRRSKDS
jgi:hypothetical protein